MTIFQPNNMTEVLVVGDRSKPISTSDLETTSLGKMAVQRNSGAGSLSRRRSAKNEAAPCDKPEIDSADGSISGNFSIRDYVSMVRSNDIRKNWPFSQKYLQICLDNGRKPLLPPFEHPQSVRDLIQEKVKFEEAMGGSDSEANEVSNGDTADNLSYEKAVDSKHSGNRFILGVDGERTQADFTKSKEKTPCQDGGTACMEADNIPAIANSCDDTKTKTEEVEEFKAPRRGEDNQRPDSIAGTLEYIEAPNAIAGRGGEDNQRLEPIADTFEYNEATNPIAGRGGEDNQRLEPIAGILECNEAPNPIAGRGEEADRELRTHSETQQFKPRRKRTERPEILSDIKNGFLRCSKQSKKTLTSETKSQEHMDSCQKERRTLDHHVEQSKADSGRTENLVNSGCIPDGMMCPVCRTFLSTSNTALNAHIDHCLDAEPTVEKTATKFTKHKIKARKKRSMVDICAVAPTRTLEDLQYTNEQHLSWDAHLLQLDDFKWNGSNVRRQPRTLLSRVAKRYVDFVNPNSTKLWNSSIFKMECLPKLHAEVIHKEQSVSEAKDKESRGTRKSKRSALRILTRAGKTLKSHGIDKDPQTSTLKHILKEGILQGKPQNGSEEIATEEKPPSSWACFNKQGSSRRKKLKHKLVSLNLAGLGQRCYNSGNVVPTNVLELKTRNHLEGSLAPLSEGTLVRSKESDGEFITHSSDKGNNLPAVVSSKRNKAKQTRKGVDINCNSAGEFEEFFTSKRMKNLSSLNFQNTTMQTVRRGQSVCESKSPTPGKAQVEQELSIWCSRSDEEKRRSSHDSCEISVNHTINSQRYESIAPAKILENETGTSVHGTQSSISCQLKRDQSKGHFSENKKLLNLKTLKRPNSFESAAGSPLKKSGLEYSNGEQKRPRNFKCNLGSPKMKRVSLIVNDLMNMKDASKIGVQQTFHGTEFNKESPEFIYDAGSTSNRAYSIKIRDCTSTKTQLLHATETSSIDREHRSSSDLQSGAMSAGELPRKPLEASVKIGHAEIPAETQAQLDSTISDFYEASKTSSHDGVVATDENLQNCMLTYTTSEKMDVAAISLEACINQPSYQRDAFTRGMGKNVTGNLSPDSPHKEKHSSEFCVSFQSQLNSCSVGELEDLYLDDYLEKKAGFPKNLDRQFNCVRDELKEKLAPVSWEYQAPSHKLSTQTDIFCHEYGDLAATILNPLNRSFRTPSSDSSCHIETSPTDISSMAAMSFQGHSNEQLKAQWAPAVSNGAVVLSSDTKAVTPVSKDTNFPNKPQASSKLTTEKLRNTKPGSTSIAEVSPLIPQSFENLARPAFDLSIKTSPPIITSIGPPPISQASFFQGRATLLEDYKSLGTSNVLTSVSMPHSISDSLPSASFGEKSTGEDVLHGSVLNLSSPKHPSIPAGVWKSSNNDSAWLSEEQTCLRQTLTSSLSNSTSGDGANGSFAENSASGFSPLVSNIPIHISTLVSHRTGVHSGSKLHPRICGNQLSESNKVSSLGSYMVTEQTDFSERVSPRGNGNCSREPSIVHIFGNPILRLMGKNVILSNTDGTQSRQMEDSCNESSDTLHNLNYPKSLESRPEAKFEQDGHSQLCQVLEKPQAVDQNMLQCFEGRTTKDPNMLQRFEAETRDLGSFWHADDYRNTKPTDSEKLSEFYTWNLAASDSRSLTMNRGQHPWLTTKTSLSCVVPESMHNGVAPGSADVCRSVKWKSPSSALLHSDPEIIILDDTIDTEVTSIAPTFIQGGSCQLQEDLLMSTHLNSSSKVRSGYASCQASNKLNHLSHENVRTLTYGSGVLNAMEIPSELKRVGIHFHGHQ